LHPYELLMHGASLANKPTLAVEFKVIYAA
jgi:hypothetical protein